MAVPFSLLPLPRLIHERILPPISQGARILPAPLKMKTLPPSPSLGTGRLIFSPLPETALSQLWAVSYFTRILENNFEIGASLECLGGRSL